MVLLIRSSSILLDFRMETCTREKSRILNLKEKEYLLTKMEQNKLYSKMVRPSAK